MLRARAEKTRVMNRKPTLIFKGKPIKSTFIWGGGPGDQGQGQIDQKDRGQDGGGDLEGDDEHLAGKNDEVLAQGGVDEQAPRRYQLEALGQAGQQDQVAV